MIVERRRGDFQPDRSCRCARLSGQGWALGLLLRPAAGRLLSPVAPVDLVGSSRPVRRRARSTQLGRRWPSRAGVADPRGADHRLARRDRRARGRSGAAREPRLPARGGRRHDCPRDGSRAARRTLTAQPGTPRRRSRRGDAQVVDRMPPVAGGGYHASRAVAHRPDRPRPGAGIRRLRALLAAVQGGPRRDARPDPRPGAEAQSVGAAQASLGARSAGGGRLGAAAQVRGGRGEGGGAQRSGSRASTGAPRRDRRRRARGARGRAAPPLRGRRGDRGRRWSRACGALRRAIARASPPPPSHTGPRDRRAAGAEPRAAAGTPEPRLARAGRGAQLAWCSASAAATSSGIGADGPSALVQLVPAVTCALRPDGSSVRTCPRATATRLPAPRTSTANTVPTTVVTAPGDRTRNVRRYARRSRPAAARRRAPARCRPRGRRRAPTRGPRPPASAGRASRWWRGCALRAAPPGSWSGAGASAGASRPGSDTDAAGKGRRSRAARRRRLLPAAAAPSVPAFRAAGRRSRAPAPPPPQRRRPPRRCACDASPAHRSRPGDVARPAPRPRGPASRRSPTPAARDGARRGRARRPQGRRDLGLDARVSFSGLHFDSSLAPDRARGPARAALRAPAA